MLLSGQGADELLCGYRKYLGFYVQWRLRGSRYLPAAREILSFWRNGTVVRQFSLAEAKRYMPSWVVPRQPGVLGPALEGFSRLQMGLPGGADVRQRQAADLTRFSVPTLTHFEDRMSMAESCEIRLPFLDPHLIDMLVGMPTDLKLREGWTKYIRV